MKNILLLAFLILSNCNFSQDNKCDCIVKLTERELKLRNALKNQGAEDYYKIKPKPGQKFSSHKVIKDSADLWYLKPYVNDVPGLKVITVRKTSQILCLVIQFNGLDSIPLYAEPKKDSNIIKYVCKVKYATTEAEKTQGFDANDHWFAGCKFDYVKINISGATSGWIRKENYLNN
jgi:hypothetical protein